MGRSVRGGRHHDGERAAAGEGRRLPVTRAATSAMGLAAALLLGACGGTATAALDTGAGSDAGGDADAAARFDAGGAIDGGGGVMDGGATSDAGSASDAGPGDDPASCTSIVALSGSDSDGAGTESAPFATLQHAEDVAVPGEVICIHEGVYAAGAALATSGTATAPITVRSYPGERAVFEQGVSFFAGWGIEVGWIVLDGIEVRNLPCCGEGIYLHSAHDVVIRRSYVHDNYGQGLLGNGVRVWIDGNVVARNGLTGVLPGLSDYHTHGMYLTGSDFRITNNVIVDNQAYGIQVAGYPWDPSDPNHPAGPEYDDATGWVIANNTIAFELNRGAIVVWQPGAHDILIENNLFFDNATSPASDTQGIEFYYSGSGNIVRNNLFFSSAGKAPLSDTGTSYTETGRVEGDPDLVDPAGGDFHLRDGSLAIDRGAAAEAPDLDHDGHARPQRGGYDIGAYELP